MPPLLRLSLNPIRNKVLVDIFLTSLNTMEVEQEMEVDTSPLSRTTRCKTPCMIIQAPNLWIQAQLINLNLLPISTEDKTQAVENLPTQITGEFSVKSNTGCWHKKRSTEKEALRSNIE